MKPSLTLVPATLALALSLSVAAETVTATFLHCGARQRSKIGGAIEAVGTIGRVDALVLAGIEPDWADALTQAYAATGVPSPGAILGTTGEPSSRILLLWDSSRLSLRDEKVEDLGSQIGDLPAPLLARMRDASGVNFVLAAASLEGSKGQQRALAAIRLAEFAESQTEPVVLLANLDEGIRVDGGSRDGSIGLLTDAGRFEWIRPKPLERTDCNLQYEAGVREFLFVSGDAKDWPSAVRTSASVEDWCARHSPRCCWEPPRCRDCGPWHLPVLATFEPQRARPALAPLTPPPASAHDLDERQLILERIAWLTAELEALRRRVEALD